MNSKFEVGKTYVGYGLSETSEKVTITKRTDKTVTAIIHASQNDPFSCDYTQRVKLRDGIGCEWIRFSDFHIVCDAFDIEN